MSKPAISSSVLDHADVVAAPPLIFLAPLLVGFLLQQYLPLPSIPLAIGKPVGALLAALAAVLVVSGSRALRRARTSPIPVRPTTAIVTDGPYRFSRNPLYLAMTLFDLGLALFFGGTWVILLLATAVVVVQKGVIEREERYLERKFGAEYLRYKARVRRWF